MYSHMLPPFFFFNDTATTEIYTLSLHDALPISCPGCGAITPPTSAATNGRKRVPGCGPALLRWCVTRPRAAFRSRSEEHTSELQSRQYLVCRLLLEKKKLDYAVLQSLAYHRSRL